MITKSAVSSKPNLNMSFDDRVHQFTASCNTTVITLVDYNRNKLTLQGKAMRLDAGLKARANRDLRRVTSEATSLFFL